MSPSVAPGPAGEKLCRSWVQGGMCFFWAETQAKAAEACRSLIHDRMQQEWTEGNATTFCRPPLKTGVSMRSWVISCMLRTARSHANIRKSRLDGLLSCSVLQQINRMLRHQTATAFKLYPGIEHKESGGALGHCFFGSASRDAIAESKQMPGRFACLVKEAAAMDKDLAAQTREITQRHSGGVTVCSPQILGEEGRLAQIPLLNCQSS